MFGEAQGYACIATAERENPRKTFKQHFFHLPTQMEQMTNRIDYYSHTRHLWFCVNLFDTAERTKEHAVPLNIVWADLDTCDPNQVEPYPTMVIQSSPDRYQALWKLEENIDPDIAEDYSRRIAYKYVQNGADPSGWDLTQLLRVPFTINFKYFDEPLVVLLPPTHPEPLAISVLEAIDRPPEAPQDDTGIDVPKLEELPPIDKILYKFELPLAPTKFEELFTIVPDASDDWSKLLWNLLMICFDAGMDNKEAFAIGIAAKCNKYKRDSRPMNHLWRDVLKAEARSKRITALVGQDPKPLLPPILVEFGEETDDTFIHRYVEWATEATDTAPEMHELAAAIVLSSVLADKIQLDVQFGAIVPNLWGMILGESTISRKTTSLNMATSIIHEVDEDIFLASDGSVEGLLTALSHRSGRSSLFFRDEVSGFFNSINKKDYLSGMPELFASLYDVPKVTKRILRKEEIRIERPVFVFLGGGIRNRVYDALDEDYIYSGFLPRFLVVSPDTDTNVYSSLGAPEHIGLAKRQKIVNDLLDLRESYQVQGYIEIAGTKVPLSAIHDSAVIKAEPTQAAWERLNKHDRYMYEVAAQSSNKDMVTPTFQRMGMSALKLGVLLAASRQEPDNQRFKVEHQDIINGAYFIQRWSRYMIELMLNAGRGDFQREIAKIRDFIRMNPGCSKSSVLRFTNQPTRLVSEWIMNLVDRGELTVEKKGRGERYWLIH